MEEAQNAFGFTLRPEGPVLSGLDRIWEDLAMSAGFPGHQPGGRALAQHVNDHPHVELITPAIATTLHELINQIINAGGNAAATARLSEFLIHLETGILVAALRLDVNLQRRNALFKNAAQVLSVRAMLRVANAASIASGVTFSKPLRDLLRKIARDASLPTPIQPEARLLFRAILTRKLGHAHPSRPGDAITKGYRLILAREAPRRTTGRAAPEADRILHTAVEIDAVGDAVVAAVTEMIEAGRERDLVALLKAAPPGGRISTLIVGRIAHPTLLGKLLHEDPVDFAVIDLLLEHVGIAAAKVMLEELAESRSRIVRRELFQRLTRLGPELGPLIEARLRDKRWFVLRNMVALARETGCTLNRHVVDPLCTHPDPRVRREALLLQLGHSSAREHAIVKGLGDTDRNVLRAAIQAARSGMPDEAATVLSQRVREVDFPPEYRVVALHLLSRSNSPAALAALLHFAQSGWTLLGKPKLAPKSPELLAALSSLARTWPSDRRASALLSAAQRSRDSQVIAACRIPAAA